MKILAIEFSSIHRSVAVVDSTGALLGEAQEINGRNIISLFEQALRSASLEREDITTLAIGLGPGSYTGIRGAISLAQGWQIGRGVQLLGISSVDCLAAQAHAQKICGEVNFIIDAQRNEFYLARFEISLENFRLADPLRLASFAEIEKLQGRGPMLGPDASSWFPGGQDLYPDAATLGRLAIAQRDFVTGDKLEPIYLRPTAFTKSPPLRVAP